MPDLLIRNLPASLHVRLKAAAAAHRRSLTQEVIMLVEKGLGVTDEESQRSWLAGPLVPSRPITMEETLRFIALARGYGQKLVTKDSRLRAACPDDTLSLDQALEHTP